MNIPQTYIGSKRPSSSNINPIKNDDSYMSEFPKPKGGFWTSSLIKVDEKYTSKWVQHRQKTNWTISENEDLYILIPSDTNLLTIENKSTFESLKSNYTINNKSRHRHINFEKIKSDGYSGVRVTSNALSFLKGWDCESTIWFNWCFKSVENVPHSKCLIDFK